jgi:hypothetical protein
MGKPAPLPRPLDEAPGSGPLTRKELEVLRRGGWGPELRDSEGDDPVLRTQGRYDALLRSSLTVEEAARRLGLTSGQVLQRITDTPPSLYAIRQGATWVLPEFQFEGAGLVPGFEGVVPHLSPELHPLGVSSWFQLPNPDLPEDDREERDLSPREWLCSGRPPAPVAALAADL